MLDEGKHSFLPQLPELIQAMGKQWDSRNFLMGLVKRVKSCHRAALHSFGV